MTRFTTAAALAVIALLATVPGAQACQGASKSASAQTADSARQTITCLINRTRRHHHLRRVRGDGALGLAAQEHSNAMTAGNFFAHEGADGSPSSRASWAGYTKGARAWSVGENLGFASGSLSSPKAIFGAWMRSPEHRTVILMGRWRDVGVGVTFGSPMGPDARSMATYTVDFGYRRG